MPRKSSPVLNREDLHIVETRIEAIAEEMRNLRFKTGVTGVELGKKWGLSIDSMKKLCAAASRRVRAEVTDPERIITDVTLVLYEVINHCRADKDSGVKGWRRDAIEAAKTLAVLTGANAPSRFAIEYEKLSDEELRAKADIIVARLSEDRQAALLTSGEEIQEGVFEEKVIENE